MNFKTNLKNYTQNNSIQSMEIIEILLKKKKVYNYNKRNKLTIHRKLKKLHLENVMMDFDATSLYPSAMWDEISVYPKIEIGIAFKSDMNDVYAEAFNNQTLNQDGNESAILRIKFYNPSNLIFQHLPVKQKG